MSSHVLPCPLMSSQRNNIHVASHAATSMFGWLVWLAICAVSFSLHMWSRTRRIWAQTEKWIGRGEGDGGGGQSLCLAHGTGGWRVVECNLSRPYGCACVCHPLRCWVVTLLLHDSQASWCSVQPTSAPWSPFLLLQRPACLGKPSFTAPTGCACNEGHVLELLAAVMPAAWPGQPGPLRHG